MEVTSINNTLAVMASLPNASVTAAPRIIGALLNWLLFGVLMVQTYIYHLSFPEDKLRSKAIVYGMLLLETAQSCLNGVDLYFWFATGLDHQDHLGNVNLTPINIPIMGGIIASVVQFFFAYRIYTLRPSFWAICIVIILASLVQLAGAVGNGTRSFIIQEFAKFHEDIVFPQSMDVWLVGDVVCDVLIALTMLWLLFVTRRDGYQEGSRILKKLVRLIVETNTLTAGMALLSFICYITLPNNPIFECTTQVIGKLYSNTLLVTFNNRIALRDGIHATDPSLPAHLKNPRTHGHPSTGDMSTFYVGQQSYDDTMQEVSEAGTVSDDKAKSAIYIVKDNS